MEKGDRMEYRRERDRILNWVLKAFLVLAIVGTVGGSSQFFLSYRLYREVAGLRAEHTQEAGDRSRRLKEWDTFRGQLLATQEIRDGEIRLMKKQIELLESRRIWDEGLAQAVRDRARQR